MPRSDGLHRWTSHGLAASRLRFAHEGERRRRGLDAIMRSPPGRIKIHKTIENSIICRLWSWLLASRLCRICAPGLVLRRRRRVAHQPARCVEACCRLGTGPWRDADRAPFTRVDRSRRVPRQPRSASRGDPGASRAWRRSVAGTGPGLPFNHGVGHSRNLPPARCHRQFPSGQSWRARRFRARHIHRGGECSSFPSCRNRRSPEAFVAVPEIEAEPLIEDEIVIVGPPELRGADDCHATNSNRRSGSRAKKARPRASSPTPHWRNWGSCQGTASICLPGNRSKSSCGEATGSQHSAGLPSRKNWRPGRSSSFHSCHGKSAGHFRLSASATRRLRHRHKSSCSRCVHAGGTFFPARSIIGMRDGADLGSRRCLQAKADQISVQDIPVTAPS